MQRLATDGGRDRRPDHHCRKGSGRRGDPGDATAAEPGGTPVLPPGWGDRPVHRQLRGEQLRRGHGERHRPHLRPQRPAGERRGLKILSYSQLFTAQWGIAEFWALRLRVLGSVYTGTNAPGVVGVGVNGLVRGSVGTTFGFQLSHNLRLGAVIDVAWGPSVAISILDSIRQSISEGSVQTPVLNTYSTTVTPTLSLAWTITRGWGALFNASYVNGVVEVNQGTTPKLRSTK